jgi:hypothetical protein
MTNAAVTRPSADIAMSDERVRDAEPFPHVNSAPPCENATPKRDARIVASLFVFAPDTP